MLEELKSNNKIVGLKQSVKAVRAGEVQKAFVAKDAEDRVILPFIKSCAEKNVPVEYCESCNDLGNACGIEVGAAIAVITK